MKKIFFLVLLGACFTADAQSLKDLLYGGKLKNDSGSVVRKGEDLSSKIDTTSKKKPVEPEKAKAANAASKDSTLSGLAVTSDSGSNTSVDTAAAVAAAPKDNNKIWKEYIDSLATTLTAEVLPSKKIKSGTYYVFVEYEIAPDGQVAINNVSPSPENSFLAQEVKERLILTAPQLNPVLYNGKPRKSVKKNTFTITKP